MQREKGSPQMFFVYCDPDQVPPPQAWTNVLAELV